MIEKALKRINEAELKVHIRGGEIVKIPAQTITKLSKDNIREVIYIDQDITDKE